MFWQKTKKKKTKKTRIREVRIINLLKAGRGFPVAQWVKRLPTMQETQETWVQSVGQEDPPEEEMASHSSILAWRIPWTESLVGYSPRITRSRTQLSG